MALRAVNHFARRVIGIVMLASTLAIAALISSLMIFDSISSRSLQQSRLSTMADVIGQNSTAALNFDDRAAAAEVLQALHAEPQIVSACLYDLSGHLFSHYERDRAHGCASIVESASNSDSQVSAVVRPVLRRTEPVGTLMLASDLSEINGRWRHLLLVAIALGVLSLALGGVSGSLLQRKVSGPIQDLARAMHEVTTNAHFGARVDVSGTEEIKELGRGFNSMLCELERRDGEKKNFEAKLQFQASNDVLTGLPNRRMFTERLVQTLSACLRENRNLGLLYIDLDGFKLVNDSLGHGTGDALLVQVATRLLSRVRQSDTLARLGGDEFTVILSSLHTREEAMLVARVLLEVLAKPFIIANHTLTIGASIGISMFPDNGMEASELMQQADSAMYAAKRNGKNRAMFFTPEIGSLVRERLNLENQLRYSLAHGEIGVHYQPEFDVSSHRLVRFEALARWAHPTLGNIPPVKFIPIAEESGLIVPLGAYVLERACREALKWQKIYSSPVQVAVNVSNVQFARERFVEEVTEILKHTGLPPHLLQLELTESVMISGVHRSADTMRRFRALGVSLAIDDFGTGYSCLSYLPSLPFDVLKIDRSFIKDLSTRPESEAMVHSLVTLAHNIGMRVIVEGVENQNQLEVIHKLGSNEVQGFLTGRPQADPCAYIGSLNDAADKDSEPALTSGVAAGSP